MPRGVKGSGTPKAKTTRPRKTKKAEAPVEVTPVVEAVAEAKPARKPYPSREQRLEMVEKDIERLTKLNAERSALIAKTEAKLAERKATLEKSEKELEKAVKRRESLIAAINKPVKEEAPKLTPEERAAKRKEGLAKAREAKKAEKAKMDSLMAALQASGKSVEELLAELNG